MVSLLQYSSGGQLNAKGLENLYRDMMEAAMEIDWVPEEARQAWQSNKGNVAGIASNLFKVCAG